MTTLRVCLFGGLVLAWDGTPLPLMASTVARSLLAYLLVHRERPHTRDLLAGTFWPDLPESTARRRLSQALWQIRKALDPHPMLVTDGDTVQIDPELPLWLDVEEFEQLAASHQPPGEPRVGDHLVRATDLYQGEFLAGTYDDWALIERERLREVYLGLLERLIAGLKARGEYEAALTHARRLAGADPLREEAHQEVMRLCHLLGRASEALQQFETCRRALAADLDAEPMAQTIALAKEIAARAGAETEPYLPARPRSAPAPRLERPEEVPLVGRQAEQAELVRQLEGAMAGGGGMVFVAGEAGVGKTRLMQTLARDAAWRGVRVAWGHSCDLSAPVPYQPLIEVLHSLDPAELARSGHLPEVWRLELGRLIPEFGPPPPLEPEQERGRLLEALARAFVALSQVAPNLLILEDVHWLDPASFEALQVLLPRLPTSRLLVVGTLRPEDLAGQPAARSSLAALESTRLPRRLALAPLTPAETEMLVQHVLDLPAPAPRFSQRLHTQTEGNPFFVAETLRTLVDGGLLYRDEDGDWSTPWDDETVSYAELPVPANIAQSIEGRVGRLAPEVQDLLGIAAVIGRDVEFDLWLAVSEGDEETVLAAAEKVAHRGLMVEADTLLGYRFAHDTVRQVVYGGLSPVRRRRWHRRVAASLEALHPNQVEALARHYSLGQNWPEAARYALQAGTRAQAVYANRQALDYYEQADGWLAQGWVHWPAGEVARWRADLAERRGQVHSLVGEYKAAGEAFERARQTWADLNDRHGEARALNRLSFLYFIQGDYVEASRHAQRALAAVPETHSVPDLRATSLTHLGLSAWSQGRYDDALSPLQEALELFEGIGSDRHGLARCLNSLSLVHLERGDLAEADACLARSLALRRQIGDRRGEGFCRYNQAHVALRRGDLAAARRELEAADQIFADIESAEGLASCAGLQVELEEARQAQPGVVRILVRLPRASAPTGRPLRDDEYVAITWTVAAPEDEAFAEGPARRRARITRLLQQAAEGGAAPTMDDLAAALNVSQPTIRRDLAALRRAGQEAQTRGSRAG